MDDLKLHKKRSLWRALLPLLLGVLLLTACDSRRVPTFTGLVTELQTGENGGLTAFVVRMDNGEEVGVLLTDDTLAYQKGGGSGTREELRKAFQAALRPDDLVRVEYVWGKRQLTTGGGARIAAYRADYIHITGGLVRGAVTMEDGTPVDLLEDGGDHSYRLADGTELLRVREPSGPENAMVLGLEGFDSLNEAAQEQVADYYRRRGLLYNEQAELKKAYALCQKTEGGFLSGWMEQSVCPDAASDRVIYFLTSLTLPAWEDGGHTVYETQLEDAFDRETGARIDTWALFTAPREVVVRTLLDKSGIDNPDLCAEMAALPWDRRIRFSPTGLSVWFEQGSLPSQPYSTGFFIDMDDEVRGLIQDWAIPQNPEEQNGTS